MKRILPHALAVIAIVSAPVAARAQSHGVGFPIGEKSRIHTNLDLGVGFDSNPDRRDTITPGGVSDWKALIRPGLLIEVPGNSLSFDMRAQLSINQYFGTGDNASVSDAKTTFGGLVGAKLRAGQRNSVVGFALDDTLVRTPATIDDLGSVAPDERRYKEWANRGLAALTLRPGGGALEFDIGFTQELSIFDSKDLPDSQREGALFEAKLKFLPKTAVLFHTDISFFDAKDADNTQGTLKSTPYNITIGLVGQITTKLSADAEVGFGDSLTWDNDFFSGVADSNTRTVIGRAELTYDLLEASRISLGYRRQVKPVILLDNYTSDMLFLRFVLGIGARLAFGAYGSYEWRNFGEGDRATQMLIGDLRVDYWFYDFLTASLNYRVLRQSADANTVMGAANEAILLEDYTRHQAMMYVGLRY